MNENGMAKGSSYYSDYLVINTTYTYDMKWNEWRGRRDDCAITPTHTAVAHNHIEAGKQKCWLSGCWVRYTIDIQGIAFQPTIRHCGVVCTESGIVIALTKSTDHWLWTRGGCVEAKVGCAREPTKHNGRGSLELKSSRYWALGVPM